MDEAASRLRIEIDSVPHELDVLKRRAQQLEIEDAALARESDAPSEERRAALASELEGVRAELAAVTERWQAEKAGSDPDLVLPGVEQLGVALVERNQAALSELGAGAFDLDGGM